VQSLQSASQIVKMRLPAAFANHCASRSLETVAQGQGLFHLRSVHGSQVVACTTELQAFVGKILQFTIELDRL
jgi:hypothetical protein